MSDHPTPSTRSRLNQHARWRLQRARRTLDEAAFIDRHHDVARSVWLASWQRSGSTWLAQMLASAPSTRLIYEPANVLLELFKDGEPREHPLPLAGPGDDLGDEGFMLDRALRGTIRSSWTEQLNRARLPTRRVIKDVRTVSVLPWLAERYPTVPMILLLRHPMAVAHSLIELGWTSSPPLDDASTSAALAGLGVTPRDVAVLHEVSMWAEHHAWAMSHPAAQRIHVVFYEAMVGDPDGELRRLRTYLEDFDAVWSSWVPSTARADAPSATSFRRTASSSEAWIDTWSSTVDPATRRAVDDVLSAVGLDALYGDGPLPLVSGDEALGALRRARQNRSGSL